MAYRPPNRTLSVQANLVDFLAIDFYLVGSHENFYRTYEEVFGHLANAEFTAREAAEYLGLAMATLRRYVQTGRLKPSRVVGRSQMFSTSPKEIFLRILCVANETRRKAGRVGGEKSFLPKATHEAPSYQI